MSSLTPIHTFLLDENVRIELFRFLQNRGFDVKLAPKAASDTRLLEISKNEQRILVTNDEDFVGSSTNEVFALIWLRMPQNDPKILIKTFEKLLKDVGNFSGKLFILKPGAWEEFTLGELEV